MTQRVRLLLNDCNRAMRSLKPGSVGAIITDPPYLISFMNRSWDSVNPAEITEEDEQQIDVVQLHAHQVWHREWLTAAFQILQPGGLIKAFSATRTFHRLAMAMQEVGFVDLHLEAWVQGQGFPKSLNLSKALDRHFGKSDGREVLGTYHTPEGGAELTTLNNWQADAIAAGQQGRRLPLVTAGATPEAKRWEGYGTALKPAFEPFVVGRKPA